MLAATTQAEVATLVTFLGYIAAVFAIGALSHRFITGGSFLKEYFLGDRGLGAWTLAFTFAATAISGGTFMGFPSLLYQNGWSVALWICSYMMVPLLTMALMGKRINQMGRSLGSITVPDVLRDRFQSRALGLVATLAIVFFLTVNLIAQFKGGGIIMKMALAPAFGDALQTGEPNTVEDTRYLIGIAIFALTVIAYTTYGGFWAVTFTDLLEGAVMLAGAIILVPLVINMAGGLETATLKLAAIDPQLVYAPGPPQAGGSGGGFLPFTLAISMFLYWPLVSSGQPSGMLRLMSFKDTPSLRRAVLVVSVYMTLTYVSLILVFTCARAIFPTEYLGRSDEIMPIMILAAAPPWLAGVLLAAPYAAIMSTVAAFILMISSALVRDIWQRNINPDMSPRAARIASYSVTAAVGVLATLLALQPPEFLQYIILFTGSGLASCFLATMTLALYWRGMTRAGALAAMLGGLGMHLGLWAMGVFFGMRWEGVQAAAGFQPLYLFGFDPSLWGILASFILGVSVSKVTAPPPAELVARLFGAARTGTPSFEPAAKPGR